MPNFNVSNVFECGRKNTDMSYERAYMATEGNEYFTDIIDHLNEYQDRHLQRLSIKNLKEAVLRVMEKKKKKSNVTSIILHAILHFSLPLL